MLLLEFLPPCLVLIFAAFDCPIPLRRFNLTCWARLGYLAAGWIRGSNINSIVDPDPGVKTSVGSVTATGGVALELSSTAGGQTELHSLR
jgi:hypothetical protein